MRTARLSIVFSALAPTIVALGCGDDPAQGACTVSGAPELQLGSGPEDGRGFTALADGQQVQLTFGVQQGFHIWTNLRARNVCFRQLKIKRQASIENGPALIASTDQLSLVAAADAQIAAQGWGELPTSRPTFLCPLTQSMPILARRLRFDLTITDTQNRTKTDSRIVVPICPDGVNRAQCETQCTTPPGGFDGGTHP